MRKNSKFFIFFDDFSFERNQKKTDCYCLEIFSLQNSVSARSKKFLFREKIESAKNIFPLTIKNLTCEKLLENNVFFSRLRIPIVQKLLFWLLLLKIGVEGLLSSVLSWNLFGNGLWSKIILSRRIIFKKISRVCASIWSSLKLQIERLIKCQIPLETRLHKTSSTQPLCLDLAMLGSKFCLTRWHLHSGQDLHRTN